MSTNHLNEEPAAERIVSSRSRLELPKGEPVGPHPIMECPSCARLRSTYVEQDTGNTAPKGSVCCASCQRVLVKAKRHG